MNMEETCSSEISVDFQRTARRYTRITDDRTLHKHLYEHLRPHTVGLSSWLFRKSEILKQWREMIGSVSDETFINTDLTIVLFKYILIMQSNCIVKLYHIQCECYKPTKLM
jgi:hypothetical protein